MPSMARLVTFRAKHQSCLTPEARWTGMCTDKSYSRKHGALWPDAVRFLDECGEELLRYTCWNYLREVTTRESDHHQSA